MTGTPQSARDLSPVDLKDNLMVVCLDMSAPLGQGSKVIDAYDIRPKIINWDVSTNAIPVTAVNGDHLKVTVAGVYNGVTYVLNDAALVIDKLGGIVAPEKQTVAVGGGSGTQVSGAVWVKSVAKSLSEPPGSALSVTQQSAYAVKRLSGDAQQLVLTIGAIPGVGGDTVVTVYSVPGTFTPSPSVPYPPGTPQSATFGSVVGNNSELDNLQFTATLNVTFTDQQAQIVVLHSGGAYSVIRYDQLSLPLLQTFDITSAYLSGQSAAGVPYDRTGFTSGDVVNYTFTAGASIDSLVIYPFDSVLSSGVPTGTPVVVAVNAASGTGSFTLPAAIAGSAAHNAAQRLYVAARVGGQDTAAIQSVTAFDFDNRAPTIGFAAPTYNGTQTVVKAAETVNLVSSSLANADLVTVDYTGNASFPIQPNTPNTDSYVVTGSGSVNWDIQRGPDGTNGPVVLTYRAWNFANGKHTDATVTVHVQASTYANATITINNGNPISTTVAAKQVPISMSSVVKLKAPAATISFPQMTLGAWSTSDGGYNWTATATIQDSAVRGTHVPNESGLLTGANSNANVTGSYKVSGFEERQVFFASIGSTFMPLVNPTSDYPAGLIVKDLSLNVIPQGTPPGGKYMYDNTNNRLVFTDYYSQFTVTNGYAWVSQTPAP